jgi:DNA-binding phage protein
MTRKSKSAASRSHEEATVESLRKDPAFAAEYLNAVLEDGDQDELMLALRRMSEAFGGMPKLAEKAELTSILFTGRFRRKVTRN